MRHTTSSASLTYSPDGSMLRFEFSYSAAMVAMLKTQVPSSARRWDPATKTWAVAPAYADQCRALAQTYLGISLPEPQPPLFSATEPTTQLIELRYLGTTKNRGDDERTALGHDGHEWRFVFPESVLRSWFGLDSDPGAASTLYAVLGIGRSAGDAEIKRAFKSAARQWHPDVCSEPNATAMFQRINEAYQILGNARLRARYDVGLTLEATAGATRRNDSWRAPLRCGWLLVTATPQLGRLMVSEIHQWTDIVNAAGQALVTSWRFGDDNYTERWV